MTGTGAMPSTSTLGVGAMSGASASATTATVGAPRVGGGAGTSSDPFWCGGSMINKLVKPKSIYAQCPTDFKSAVNVKCMASQGLKESFHLRLEDEKEAVITLSAWVDELHSKFEYNGMDSIFRIYDAKTREECYLLEEWGASLKEGVKNWVQQLQKD